MAGKNSELPGCYDDAVKAWVNGHEEAAITPVYRSGLLSPALSSEEKKEYSVGQQWQCQDALLRLFRGFQEPLCQLQFRDIDMLLVIDNYDSFTYNLVQYLGEMSVELQVHRNDQITLDQIRALKPQRILVSPGPCSPKESGLSNDIIRTFSAHIPTLGVCLGHQCIGHVFGANIVVNYRMMHGKTSMIKHNGKDLFQNMPNPFAATRYHSLVIQRDSMPDCLAVTAETDEGEIMGVKHKQFPIWGVQFHPESILTESGRQILKNFLTLN